MDSKVGYQDPSHATPGKEYVPGNRPLGLMARYSGVLTSAIGKGISSYGRPSSRSTMATLPGFMPGALSPA